MNATYELYYCETCPLKGECADAVIVSPDILGISEDGTTINRGARTIKLSPRCVQQGVMNYLGVKVASGKIRTHVRIPIGMRLKTVLHRLGFTNVGKDRTMWDGSDFKPEAECGGNYDNCEIGHLSDALCFSRMYGGRGIGL
jgi:hypothetical protein